MTGFPISLATPMAHDGSLPAAADVVVIGGGIIGVMTAWFLAKRGQNVVLCEKGRIAGEQSSRNWGWVRQQGRDPAELPIMVEARQIWQGLERETGEDLGYRETGVAYLANNEKSLASFEAWLSHARDNNVDSKMLSSRQIAKLIPGAKSTWPGGLWTPSDGRAEPWIAVPALARAAARNGVTIRESCAVRGVDLAAGKVCAVETELGRIKTSAVVLAGGAWSSLLARNLGVELPQLSVRATVAATSPMPEVFAGGATDDHLAYRRRLDGGYTIAPPEFHELFIGPDAFRRLTKFVPQLKRDPFGTKYFAAAPKAYPDAWGTARGWSMQDRSPFEDMRVLGPRPNLKQVAKITDAFARLFPEIGTPKIKLAWAGMIDTMPDTVPVIDRCASVPGLTIATGTSGHGFGIGPGFGRVVADLVLGNPVGHDLSRFRLSRFTDGSKLDLGPAL